MLAFYLNYQPVEDGQGEKVWNDLSLVLQQAWNTRLNLERTQFGLVSATYSPLVPLAVFREFLEIVNDHSGHDGTGAGYTAAMVVDTGNPESLVARVDGQYRTVLKPWELYASPSAFEEMRVLLDKSVELTFDGILDSRYGLLLIKENEHFLFSKALNGRGESPCFYCGSRKHPPSLCPSKQIFTSIEAMEKLARSSLSYGNRCFLRYITRPDAEIQSLAANPHSDSHDKRLSLAHLAFYDVKRLFQLRFFRLFFGADRLDWEAIRNSKGQHSQGGPTWLALDCLRVGDTERAKYYAEMGIDHDPMDWKSQCMMGFLNIEKDGLGKAEDCFEKALDLSRRVPQRILLNLLLSRVNWLNQEPQKARERARAAMLLDRWCHDALYQLIVLDFNLSKNEQPLQGLEKLVRYNGYYWMCSYIDPDLAPFSADIHPRLSRIAAEARHEAEIMWREARSQFRGVKSLLRTDSKILQEGDGLISSMVSKADHEGYLDSIERLRAARVLKSLSQKAVDEQRQRLKKALEALRSRIDEVNREVGAIEGDTLPRSIEGFNALKREIETAYRNSTIDFVNTYQEIMTRKEAYATQLEEIRRELKTWKARKQISTFLVTCLVRTSGLLFATFALTLLFPFVIAAIQTLFPQSKIHMNDYGHLQRVFIVVGVFLSMAISAVSSYSRAYGNRLRQQTRAEPGERPSPSARQKARSAKS